MALPTSPASHDQSDGTASRIIPFVLPRINLEPRALLCYIQELGYQHPAASSSLLPALAELVIISACSSAESTRVSCAAEPFFKPRPRTADWRKAKKPKHTHTHRQKWWDDVGIVVCPLGMKLFSWISDSTHINRHTSSNTLTSQDCTEN